MNLALATWTFAINFWAWNLIGPLSATYTKDMSLTSTQAALLVATPILVGSVGRIPVALSPTASVAGSCLRLFRW